MSFLGSAGVVIESAGLIVSRVNGAVLGFFVVKLFGEVQDECDETIGVRFRPHARRRGDATAGVGGAGEVGHGGEVLALAPGSCLLFVPGSQCSEVCALCDAFAAFFGRDLFTGGIDLLREGL